MTNSIAEIEDADCILVIGSNTTSSHPLVATRIFRAKQKGAKIIVVDPRRVQLVHKADLFMQHNLGTDVALINGMMHVILASGWHKQDFIDAVKTRGHTLEDAEVGHRTTSLCHLGHIAIRVGGKLQWDPRQERFLNSDAANAWIDKPMSPEGNT